MEGVVEQINQRLEDVNASMTALEKRMKSVEMRMNVHTALLLLLWATVIAALLIVLFKG